MRHSVDVSLASLACDIPWYHEIYFRLWKIISPQYLTECHLKIIENSKFDIDNNMYGTTYADLPIKDCCVCLHLVANVLNAPDFNHNACMLTIKVQHKAPCWDYLVLERPVERSTRLNVGTIRFQNGLLSAAQSPMLDHVISERLVGRSTKPHVGPCNFRKAC